MLNSVRFWVRVLSKSSVREVGRSATEAPARVRHGLRKVSEFAASRGEARKTRREGKGYEGILFLFLLLSSPKVSFGWTQTKFKQNERTERKE